MQWNARKPTPRTLRPRAKEARASHSENEVHRPQVIDSSLELNRSTWQKHPRAPLTVPTPDRVPRSTSSSSRVTARIVPGMQRVSPHFGPFLVLVNSSGFLLATLRLSARGSLEFESQRPPLEGSYSHDNAAGRPLGVACRATSNPSLMLDVEIIQV